MRLPLAAPRLLRIRERANKSTTLGLPPGKHGEPFDLLLHLVYLGLLEDRL